MHVKDAQRKKTGCLETLDTLTHALSGALLARATTPKDAPPRSLPRRIAAGFLACAAPDLDFVAGFLGPVEYIAQHRGVTHSLLLLPLWALPLSWLLAKILREPRGWRALYGVAAMSIGLHIAGDVITGYGTMVFAPFSDWRAAHRHHLHHRSLVQRHHRRRPDRFRFSSKNRELPSVAALAFLACLRGISIHHRKQKALEFGRAIRQRERAARRADHRASAAADAVQLDGVRER